MTIIDAQVLFDDGHKSQWMGVRSLKTSGIDKTTFVANFTGEQLHENIRKQLCDQDPSIPPCGDIMEALRAIRERVLEDRLPLLSLLQAEPLQMQSSHLSFQEFYTAKALCRGMCASHHTAIPPPRHVQRRPVHRPRRRRAALCTVADRPAALCRVHVRRAALELVFALLILVFAHLMCSLCSRWVHAGTLKLPSWAAAPWQWSEWWRNTLRLGAELNARDFDSASFGAGLLAATGEANDKLDLNAKLGGEGLDFETALMATCELCKSGAAMIGLFKNNLGAQGVEKVVSSIQSDRKTAVTDLNLGDNQASAAGAQALAGLIQTSTVVKRLRLASNGFGTEGGLTIAKALSANTTLESIDLTRNALGGDVAVALAEGLTSQSGLVKVDIRFNDFDEQGSRLLAQTVVSKMDRLELFSEVPVSELRQDKNPALRLGRKGLGPTEAFIIAELIRGLVNLRTLELQDNCLCGVKFGMGSYVGGGFRALLVVLQDDSACPKALELVNLANNDYETSERDLLFSLTASKAKPLIKG